MHDTCKIHRIRIPRCCCSRSRARSLNRRRYSSYGVPSPRVSSDKLRCSASTRSRRLTRRAATRSYHCSCSRPSSSSHCPAETMRAPPSASLRASRRATASCGSALSHGRDERLGAQLARPQNDGRGVQGRDCAAYFTYCHTERSERGHYILCQTCRLSYRHSPLFTPTNRLRLRFVFVRCHPRGPASSDRRGHTRSPLCQISRSSDVPRPAGKPLAHRHAHRLGSTLSCASLLHLYR